MQYDVDALTGRNSELRIVLHSIFEFHEEIITLSRSCFLFITCEKKQPLGVGDGVRPL